jgi:tetratricopeptide (TPR) repeat protein
MQPEILRAGFLIVAASGIDDLDAAIELLREELPHTPEPHSRLRLLASAYQTRHRVSAAPDDLDRCGRYLAELLDALPENAPDRPETEAWLGRVLLTRAAGRSADDLDAAVRLLSKAAARLPEHSPVLRDLCEALTLRWRSGDRTALDPLIEARRTLLRLDPSDAASARSLALALADRSPPTPAARDEAISLLLALAPDARTGLADTERLVLARLLARRALATGGADAERALELLTPLAESKKLSGEERDQARVTLRGLRELRGAGPDDPVMESPAPHADLREAARALAETLRRLAADHPMRPRLTVELAEALSELDSLDDLPVELLLETGDRDGPVRGLALLLRGDDVIAIPLLERVLDDLPDEHPLRGPLSARLGTRLAWRAEALGDLDSLDAADRYLKAAIACYPDDPGLRIRRAAHHVTMARHRSLPDLADAAIRVLESDLATLSTVDPWYPQALWALGEAWSARGSLRGGTADRNRGLELVIEAAAALPDGHPDRARLAAAATRAREALSELPSLPVGPTPADSG